LAMIRISGAAIDPIFDSDSKGVVRRGQTLPPHVDSFSGTSVRRVERVCSHARSHARRSADTGNCCSSAPRRAPLCSSRFRRETSQDSLQPTEWRATVPPNPQYVRHRTSSGAGRSAERVEKHRIAAQTMAQILMDQIRGEWPPARSASTCVQTFGPR